MHQLKVLFLALSLSIPAGAFAVGAIAVDDVEGDSAADVGYFAVTGEDSEASAKAAAMKGCRAEGMKNCKIGVWFTRCGAYASGPKTTGYATGGSKDAVAREAVETCGSGCKLVIAECE